MNRKEIIDMSDPDCPGRNVLARICDKWSVLIVLVLKDAEVMRFNEIQKSIPDISQKMLTVTLRTLEEDGFVKRKIYAAVPPKVEYSLTERAQSLLPLIDSLVGWAKEKMDSIIKDRKASVRCHQ
ncbi:MAG: helix-turn-helix domain-containing protein [Bacteroidales bacterium]|nr:helix-turn-helix domain-containing protein [Bacteroidales bacterium]MDY6001676.1 helix-turn-helix domain-containing protein [Candidatus Cryptobacteroides sp.]